MDLFTLRNIDAYMDRKVLPIIHLPALYEQFLQFILQPVFFSLYSEVIGSDPAAMFVSKLIRQNSRKSP